MRVINIVGIIGQDVSLLDVVRQTVDPQPEAYIVNINSPGGYVKDGFEIYNYLKSLNVPIITRGYGEVMSIATVIFMAGNVREIEENTKFLIHKVAVTMPDMALNESQLFELAELIKDDEKQILKFYKDNSVLNESAFKMLMEKETTIPTQDLLTFGIVHNIIKTEMDKVTVAKNGVVNAMLKAGLIKPANLSVELADGQRLFVYTEDGEVEGKQVVLADSEGNPTETPAPDGDHALQDGRIVTVSGGVITGVRQAENMEKKEEKEAYNAEAIAKEIENKVLAAVNAKIESVLSAITSTYDHKAQNNAKANNASNSNEAYKKFIRERIEAKTKGK